MGEYVDLYDENKKRTNEMVFREKGQKAIIPKNKYIVVVICIIINSANEFLIQKVSKVKGSVWALTGGHVKSGQTSIEAMIEEINEELGINLSETDLTMFKSYKYENAFKDVYILRKNINIEDLNLQAEEVELVKFINQEDLLKLIEQEKIRSTNVDALIDFLKNYQ